MRRYDNLIRFGGSIKVLESKGDLRTVGGLGVIYDDPSSPTKDLTGDYFTRESYFGAHKGDGMDGRFNHGLPVSNLAFAKALSEYIFPAVKAEEDEYGLVVSIVLDLRKEYERFAFEQLEKKALSWSSGAVGHMVMREEDGWLKRWPIGDWSRRHYDRECGAPYG